MRLIIVLEFKILAIHPSLSFRATPRNLKKMFRRATLAQHDKAYYVQLDAKKKTRRAAILPRGALI